MRSRSDLSSSGSMAPTMGVGFGVYQLSIDAHPFFGATDTSFQHIAYSQFMTDLPRVERPVPIGERGMTRNHQHVGEPRQIGRQILGDPVSKKLLALIAAKIFEGQDDD